MDTAPLDRKQLRDGLRSHLARLPSEVDTSGATKGGVQRAARRILEAAVCGLLVRARCQVKAVQEPARRKVDKGSHEWKELQIEAEGRGAET